MFYLKILIVKINFWKSLFEIFKRKSIQIAKSLIKITIPTSVTSIKNYAFEKCISLLQILIPSSIISMSDKYDL